ncbi:CoA transferase subunit A [Nocardioides halotolerans]|uniref:CoA transferase subunit A n=1 Tax=Nocardioides halotolerans TaxID=433660 RepID=UPI0004149401|nr:CoA-transferase [Nocardioides halotolerans]
MTARRSVLASVSEAVDRIDSGMALGIGGLGTSSHPMSLIREIVRRGLRDLDVVAGPMAALDVDLLIAAGCVRSVTSSYVGGERVAPIGPAYRRAVQAGYIEVREVDEGIFCQGLRAAAQLLPYATWRGGVGTALVDLNPGLTVVDDPYGGPPVLAVRATPLDVTILHAAYADPYGNIQHVGTGFDDRLLAAAADVTVVSVEQVISNEAVRRAPWFTTLPDADVVVRSPGGAHPYASPGFYVEDVPAIQDYAAAARAGGEELEGWLRENVHECGDELDYLDRLGLRRFFDLQESPL